MRKKKHKKKHHTVGTVPKPYRKIVKRATIETPNTQIHDCSYSWLSIGTSIESGEIKLALPVQTC